MNRLNKRKYTLKRVIPKTLAAFSLALLATVCPPTLGQKGLTLSQAAFAEPAVPVQVRTIIQSTTGDLIIPAGVTATYDASKGPLKVQGRFENRGTLEITGSVDQAKIETSNLKNSGTIISKIPNLTINNNSAGAFVLDLESGHITAPVSIGFVSQTDIKLAGGNIAAERISFITDQKLRAHANRIDGKIDISSTVRRSASMKVICSLKETTLLLTPFTTTLVETYRLLDSRVAAA